MVKFLFLSILMVFSLSHAGPHSPEDGTVLNYTHVLFQWDQEPDAGLYNLQVSISESFNNVILDINEETTIYIEKDTLAWENTYYWRVRPIDLNGNNGDWSELSSFSIGEPLPNSNLNINIYNDELVQEGLMMFTQIAPYFAVMVIDKFGNLVWISQSSYINHWNGFGQLYGMMGFGRGGKITFYNQILWMTPVGTNVDGHEIKQIPNGNYMAFVPSYQLGPIPLGDWTENFQSLGYVADGVTNEFQWMGLKIVEWDQETGEEAWNWDPFEHFTIDDYDLYGGAWWWALSAGRFDWMHPNAFHFDEDESVIYVSHRHLSRISKISYPSGEVIWNMGLPAEYNTGDQNICTDLLFSFQHHIQMLDDGDLLFFDNGNLSEMLLGDPYPTSRIRRVRVIDDSYCETVWQYDLPQNIYGSSTGSVQLLQNGNYLICTLGDGLGESESSVVEITPEKNIVWKATAKDESSYWYRAYKIPSIHPNAFSVLFDQYRNVDIDENPFTGVVLDNMNASLSFTIYNHSGYNQPYVYSLSDDNEWFPTVSDTVFIDAEEQSSFSFYPDINRRDLFTSLRLVVTPVHHDWYAKDLYHEIFAMPQIFKIDQNYPNPFNSVTTLRYNLPEDELVNITIYDILGRIVKNLVSSHQRAGYKSIQWNATNSIGQPVSAGLYLYTIEAGKFRQTKKMVLLK